MKLGEFSSSYEKARAQHVETNKRELSQVTKSRDRGPEATPEALRGFLHKVGEFRAEGILIHHGELWMLVSRSAFDDSGFK